MLGTLGRLTPPDFEHVSKYPLTALKPEVRPVRVPVVMGTFWYLAMDAPSQGEDGIWRINDGTAGWGAPRGGHAYCLEPAPEPQVVGREIDTDHNWRFFNQGQEGACEGFAHARMMALLHGRTFDAFWLYDDARRIDGTYPDGGGTFNRSTMAALAKWGAHYEDGEVCAREKWSFPKPGHGVKVYRWATDVGQILDALGTPHSDFVVLLNSWGTSYPHRVRLSCTALERLLSEEGEAGMPVGQ